MTALVARVVAWAVTVTKDGPVADGAAVQSESIGRCLEAVWDIWPRPQFTLVPITPERLAEKQEIGDFFFDTVFKEGQQIGAQN